LDLLEQAKFQAVILQKSNEKQSRAFDSDRYRWRHLIENFFVELKQYRAIATRYDKRPSAFLGGVPLAAIAICLNDDTP
jgi:transposase